MINPELSFDLASIVLIDLVLAGDNAVVIGMAARPLLPEQRRVAIQIGTLFAVALRILATFLVVHLLRVPLLSALGGVLVCAIALKLLVQNRHLAASERKARSLWHAVRLIAAADLIMSTDNILAVGGASGGHFGLVLFGLGLSIPLVMFCSCWIAVLLERYPRLWDLGGGVLGWTGAQMILHDLMHLEIGGTGLLSREALGAWFGPVQWGTKLGLAIGVVLTAKLWLRARERCQKYLLLAAETAAGRTGR